MEKLGQMSIFGVLSLVIGMFFSNYSFLLLLCWPDDVVQRFKFDNSLSSVHHFLLQPPSGLISRKTEKGGRLYVFLDPLMKAAIKTTALVFARLNRSSLSLSFLLSISSSSVALSLFMSMSIAISIIIDD